MGGEERPKGPSDRIEEWEWKLVKELVRQTRPEDPDYLETKLLVKLTRLKATTESVRNWEDFLWISLRNHGLNIVRRLSKMKTVSIDSRAPVPSAATLIRELAMTETAHDPEKQNAMGAALQDFTPKLRRLWDALKRCKGNQTAAARRMRKHRNTIRNWIKQMRPILERHGLL